MSSSLVTVHNQTENVYIQHRNNGEKSWIGLNDRSVEGSFVWTNKELSSFRFWARNQPNNWKNEDCVHTLVPGTDIPGTMYRAITATTSLALPVIFKITFYEITKIVGALWLAERSVCMRVCKHGFEVKMSCFSRTNHASKIWKRFLSSKLDKFTLFNHSFVGWNLEHLYKQTVSILFSLKLTF